MMSIISRPRIMDRFTLLIFLGVSLFLFMSAESLSAETGAQAWLRCARLDEHAPGPYDRLPSGVVTLGDSALSCAKLRNTNP
jgi:hypothetical protein